MATTKLLLLEHQLSGVIRVRYISIHAMPLVQSNNSVETNCCIMIDKKQLYNLYEVGKYEMCMR